MVVVVIIGALAAYAIVNYMNAGNRAKEDIAHGYVKGPMKTQISLYQMRNNSLPNSLTDLVPTYFEEFPKDPWGEPYQYRIPGTHNPNSFDVWSKGLDKIDGTGDDIGNWSDTPTP